MISLSKRLRAIAEKVEQGSRLADIGSDHALLPAFLAKEGRIAFAVAGELNPGPFEAAGRQIQAAGLGKAVSVRRGNGLEVVAPGEADTVTVAGMGGALIAEILEAGRLAGKLAGVKRLILQPNVGEELVRRWLRATGWLLIDEEILEEDGKIYEILTAVPAGADGMVQEAVLYAAGDLEGFGRISEEDWLRFGPFLLKRAEPVWMEKWKRETAKLERVVRSLDRSELAESQVKRLALLEEINRLKELIACLQRGKPSFS